MKPKFFTLMKQYSKEQFYKDVIAGIIVAIIALPLSIALAIASGVTPEKGLHTAIVAGFLISFLGGSRVQIGGPTGAFMVIVFGVVAEHGVDGLILATFMAGILLVLFGILKLGSIIKFMPYPIVTGFTSGIAVVIFSSQVKDFLGLTIEKSPAEFIGKWEAIIHALPTISITTLIVGLVSLLIIVFWPKVNKTIPGAFVALVVMSVLVTVFKLDVATIGTKFGDLSSSIPPVKIPAFSMEKVQTLMGPAITIAVLGAIESLLSAVVSDGMIGGKHRSNTELIAQGIANMGSALFGGIPATGAIARTMANIKNGGRTPVAGMVHAITLLLIMLLFMPLAKMIPLATLAAILIVVAYNMSEWREFVGLFKSTKSDVLILVVTFGLTVFVDLVVAIEAGVVLAAFLFMKRMVEVSSIEVTHNDGSDPILEDMVVPKGMKVYEINGPFFFGAADKFIEQIAHVDYSVEHLVVRMRNVPAMDATALKALKRLIKSCESRNIEVSLVEIKEQPQSVLDQHESEFKHRCFKTLKEVLVSV